MASDPLPRPGVPSTPRLPVSPRPWWHPFTGGWTAAFVLTAFWMVLMGSVREKSTTCDEIVHATAGYSYWRFNDYRLNPENGNLPQRIMSLPLVLSFDSFPSRESESWQASDEWAVSDEWFHHRDLDVAALLFRGRAMMALVAVALGTLVWSWSRRLFGPLGGMLSLLLYVLNPSILANGPLMTSDITAAFFFLAAMSSLWSLLHRISLGKLGLSALCVAGLFLSKMSALLLVPMALVLLVARLIDGRPLPIDLGLSRELRRRSQQAIALLGAIVIVGSLAWTVLWGFYGFRYSAFAHVEPGRDRFTESWESLSGKTDPILLLDQLNLTVEQQKKINALFRSRDVAAIARDPNGVEWAQAIRREVLTAEQARRWDELQAASTRAGVVRATEFARRHRLLPEAYLYGQLHAWAYARARNAFLNGDYSNTGWPWFFPYTFLVKTPLTMFAIAGLAIAAAVQTRRERRRSIETKTAYSALPGFYATLPLWTLFGLYWIVVLFSHLNIGHRHILATYPAIFVLCGAAALWLERQPVAIAEKRKVVGRSTRTLVFVLCGLVVGLAVEMIYRFPNYLAYFNLVAGGPASGYRHLVDSSLDWGQDLPAVKSYLERRGSDQPVYLSYFGTASPRSYGIPAQLLSGFPGRDVYLPLRMVQVEEKPMETIAQELLRQHPDYRIMGSVRSGENEIGVLLLQTPEALRLSAGTYLFSATMLQSVMYPLTGPMGTWNQRFEARYQELDRAIRPFMSDDPEVRLAALKTYPLKEWRQIFDQFELYRCARLAAYLRKKEPDDQINFSILVYHLRAEEVAAALEGPPPELGRDWPMLFTAQKAQGQRQR